MERRKAERFAIRMRYHMKLGLNGSALLTGVTENISRTGMAVRILFDGEVGRTLVAGDYCEVYLELPQHPRASRRCLRCRSTVAWIEDAGPGEVLAGLNVNAMDFRDLPGEAVTGSADEESTPSLLM